MAQLEFEGGRTVLRAKKRKPTVESTLDEGGDDAEEEEDGGLNEDV